MLLKWWHIYSKKNRKVSLQNISFPFQKIFAKNLNLSNEMHPQAKDYDHAKKHYSKNYTPKKQNGYKSYDNIRANIRFLVRFQRSMPLNQAIQT